MKNIAKNCETKTKWQKSIKKVMFANKSLRIYKPKCEEKDGCCYEGEWVGDRKHGSGVQEYINGAKYEG